MDSSLHSTHASTTADSQLNLSYAWVQDLVLCHYVFEGLSTGTMSTATSEPQPHQAYRQKVMVVIVFT